MVNCGTLLKSALVALVLVVAVESGPIDEKLSTCCRKVSSWKPTEPIIGYTVQIPHAPCVGAVIFQTEKRHYCTYGRAPWVRSTIKELNVKAQVALSPVAPTSPVSLLSIITSTASPPSPSADLSSFAATSEMPTSETFSESRE